MKKLTLTLLTIFGLSATSSAADLTANDHEMKLLWGAWKDTHSKNYSEAEELHRLNIFAENYNKIIAHNAKNSTVTLALNKFADITGDEFKSRYAGGHIPHNNSAEDIKPNVEDKRFLGSTNSLPASVDWRKKGAVTPVKNQKSCQGCWSFAASGGLEALHFIKTGSLLSFSEQQLLDCDKTSHGCGGGHMLTALSYTAKNGIELESEYPFRNKVQTCKYSSKKAYHVNTGYTTVRSHDAEALMTAIVSRPVLVAIEANQSVFQFYKSGVITSGCGSATDHAVLAVGYTTVNGHKAFIIKNSFGPDWGESGYVYISTSSSANGGKGVCGILSMPGYPTV